MSYLSKVWDLVAIDTTILNTIQTNKCMILNLKNHPYPNKTNKHTSFNTLYNK